MKKICRRARLWFLCLFLSGCILLPNESIGQAAQTPMVDKGAAQVDPLDVYRANLVPEFQDDLKNMDSATRYQVEVSIADTITDISGRQVVTYSNNETTDLDEVYFRLFPNASGEYMTVQNVQINNKDVTSALEHLDTALRVDLPAPLKPGESITISMDFNQHVPDVMGGNYGLYVFQDGVLALDQFIPTIPVYNEQGWNVEDPPLNADMVFNDAAFFEVVVDAPSGLILAGSGVEISSSSGDNRQEKTYVGGPQRDFYLAASPLFHSASQQVGDTRVTSYFIEEDRDAGEKVLATAVKALESYSERFGLYPYTELDLISTPMQAGGMEYSGAVSLSLAYYDQAFSSKNPSAAIFLEAAAAHEVAHQWFFDQLMNDQIEQPWLDEALVQYATYLYYLDRYGESAGNDFMESWNNRWRSVDSQPIPIGKPAGEYSRAEYSAVIYGRGPFFFVELKNQMGEEKFNQLLKDYVTQYRWKNVDADQFRDLAETNCKCNLDELFMEWIE